MKQINIKFTNDHEKKTHYKPTNILILCGGFGSRISKITKKVPKPLIKVIKKPFLYYLIKNLSRYNFINFYLLTYYKNENFVKFKKKYEKELNVRISIIREKEKLDTGGSILNATKKFSSNSEFLVLNGDTYIDLDFDRYYKKFKKISKLLLPIIKKDKCSAKLNSLNINKDKRIYFSNKNKFMNSGIYFFFKRNISKFYKYKKCSFENLILKKKINKNMVYGEICTDSFIDIGSYQSINILEKFIQNIFYKKKLLFLDRDNTLNYDDGYVHKVKNLKVIKKNIVEIKKKYKNYLKVIISNQSGIGRKIFNKKDFDVFTNNLIGKLYEENIFVSKVYYCPHHLDAKEKKYKKKCNFRKPNAGMINMALKKLEIMKGKNCLIIGNDKNDQELSKRTNIQYVDANKII
jgi:D,D-heptose 1,7-bisphosphate phosphatase